MKGSREYPASKRHTSGAPPRAEVLHPMWLMAHRYEHVDQSATHIAQWRRDGPSPQSRRDVERAIGYGYGVLFSRRHGLSYPLDIVCDAFEGVSRRWDAERTPRERRPDDADPLWRLARSACFDPRATSPSLKNAQLPSGRTCSPHGRSKV
jgi:hypothetical protein